MVSPHQGAGDPAPVEREGGEEVEAEDGEVDVELVVDEGEPPRGQLLSNRHPDDPQQPRDHGGHRGARSREPQLVPRLLRLSLQTRHATQQPEVDLLHRDAVPAGDHGVRELVQDDAGEEAQGAQEAECVGGRLAQRRIRVGEVGAAQRPGDQPNDD